MTGADLAEGDYLGAIGQVGSLLGGRLAQRGFARLQSIPYRDASTGRFARNEFRPSTAAGRRLANDGVGVAASRYFDSLARAGRCILPRL